MLLFIKSVVFAPAGALVLSPNWAQMWIKVGPADFGPKNQAHQLGLKLGESQELQFPRIRGDWHEFGHAHRAITSLSQLVSRYLQVAGTDANGVELRFLTLSNSRG